jgi:hypothetical protein
MSTVTADPVVTSVFIIVVTLNAPLASDAFPAKSFAAIVKLYDVFGINPVTSNVVSPVVDPIFVVPLYISYSVTPTLSVDAVQDNIQLVLVIDEATNLVGTVGACMSTVTAAPVVTSANEFCTASELVVTSTAAFFVICEFVVAISLLADDAYSIAFTLVPHSEKNIKKLNVHEMIFNFKLFKHYPPIFYINIYYYHFYTAICQ